MADIDRNSYDGFNTADINIDFTDGDEIEEETTTVKKLSDAFDNCAKGEGNMKVYLRIRPMPSKCTSESTIIVESDQTIVTNAPESSKRAQYTKLEERKYAFSRIFSPNSLQSDVYEHAMSPLLDRFVKGDNCVFFAYGMTNSGKTHTIQGSSADQGLLPRLVSDILRSIEDSRPIDDWRLSVSVLEIYQEKIFDLLGKKSEKPEKLTIRDGNGKIEVCKLSEHSVTSIMDATRIMDLAATNRSKSTTLLNSGSSRSHAVYTLTLKSENLGKDVVFQVVDLAGAERSNRTKANVQQQKEANNINTSLMQLWRCLQGMQRKGSESNSEKNIDIIPFRDSKLTHLLMPQLCRAGLSGVAMIACVNPQIDDYDETLSILGNASLASKIKEIADLRRPVTTSSHIQQSSSEEMQSSKVAAVAANAISAATALGKRRRAEYNNLTQADTSSVIEKRISKRCSAIAQKATAPCPAVEDKVRPVSKRVGAVKFAADAPGEKAEVEDERATSGVKRLRDEISRLTIENNLLLSEQFTRETDIRIEVSLEMAKRSAHLLDQIQDLQYQLDGKDSSENDLSKSCKKMRRDQLDKANDDMARDLEEAEEELERVKIDYEEQLLQLRIEKKNLAAELKEWKSKILFQQVDLIKSLSPSRESAVQSPAHSSTAALCPEVLPASSLIEVTITASSEIPKRMSRDVKCRKSEKESECANRLNAIRSPLGPVKVDPNSEKSPKERGSSGNWESPQGDGISPLRFDSSPKEMYRHKENLHAQLQQSFSASKSYHNSCNKSVASAEKVGGSAHTGAHCQVEVKQVPKARATVVSARRVISTRLTHQTPEELLAHEAANCGANPNAGNYISRLRTRTVR